MSINKRELELSQALMTLQVQYNELQRDNNALRNLSKALQANLNEATKRVDGLLASVSVLKSTQKKVVSAVSKNKKLEVNSAS